MPILGESGFPDELVAASVSGSCIAASSVFDQPLPKPLVRRPKAPVRGDSSECNPSQPTLCFQNAGRT